MPNTGSCCEISIIQFIDYHHVEGQPVSLFTDKAEEMALIPNGVNGFLTARDERYIHPKRTPSCLELFWFHA